MLSGQWVKGCESATCVEVLLNPHTDNYEIRTSDFPEQIIEATEGEWLQFVKAVKDGRFD